MMSAFANKTIAMPNAFQAMAKPVGSRCNLDCAYCYYLEKGGLYGVDFPKKMPNDVLENFIKQYIQGQVASEIHFVWQGGEPTLLGIEYFEKILRLQRKCAGKKLISNSLQTNGTLLNDDWCQFLKLNDFLVGISLDGMEKVHDYHRVYKKGNGSFRKVMRGVECLHKYQVDFNTLSVVSEYSSQFSSDIYRFLKSIGSGFMQFIPVVERKGYQLSSEKRNLVTPDVKAATLTDWSVRPHSYGDFLVTIFEEWVRNDVGRFFVQIFDVTLANWVGEAPSLCVFSEFCGNALVVECNGDVYSCDHFVYPQYKIGNIRSELLMEMLQSNKQLQFGIDKKQNLPSECLGCEYLFACHGECPKHRFCTTAKGEYGLNYLCGAYKKFFSYVKPYMDFMSMELRQQRPPSNVMDWVKCRIDLK